MNLRSWITIAALALAPACAAAQADLAPVVEVRTLSDGVWIHTTFRTFDDGLRFPSHGLIVREGESLTLIDTAWGEENTELLLDAIAVQIGLPVTRAVVTHAHGDRLGGTEVLEAQGVEVWAHPMTVQIAKENDRPVPDHVLEGLETPGDVVAWGGFEVFYPGPAHAMDNIMVWLPGQQILFGGCAIRGTADQGLGNVRDGDVGHWSTAMALTEQLYGDAELVVSSHADPAGPELIGHTASLVRGATNSED